MHLAPTAQSIQPTRLHKGGEYTETIKVFAKAIARCARAPASLIFFAHLAWCPAPAFAEDHGERPGAESTKENNGTDPTRVSRTVQFKYEYLALRDNFSSSTLRVLYTQPLGNGYSAVFKLPISRVNVLGNEGSGLGDVSIQLGKVFGLNRDGGNVVQAEVYFDTATRPELGAGNSILKATYIRAFFLQSGAIFAPSLVQSVSLQDGDERPKTNLSTLDFYYVPKMDDPRNLITYNPNVNYNWENGHRFASLAVTLGRNIGPSPFGGNHFILVKPLVMMGGDRPNKWGVELIYRVIGC